MHDQLLSRSGYVYCVRRSGKTLYRLGSAPAGQLVDRLKKLAQTEENPTALRLVGWIEVQDHALAAKTIRETFHLYQLQDDCSDHWFDFRVARSSELKSLMGVYADLMLKLPVAQPLIVDEPQPQYDRSFNFFETLNTINNTAYLPPDIPGIPVFPSPEKQSVIQQVLQRSTPILPAHWIGPWKPIGLAVIGIAAIGLGATTIGLHSTHRTQVPQSPVSTPVSTPNQPPSSKPSKTPDPQLTQPSPPSTPKPKPKQPIAPAPMSSPAPIAEVIPNDVPNGERSTIGSSSFGGARLRSDPDDAASDIDFIPNGTPVTLGESSGAWQEIILPDGRSGWVFNDTIQE